MARNNKLDRRRRRRQRIRRRVRGTPQRPRLTVYRSLQHIYAQVIDDTRGVTLAAASTVEPEAREQCQGLTKVEQAAVVGRLVAARALDNGVSEIVFDRNGSGYHGRVRSLAEAAREAGLTF